MTRFYDIDEANAQLPEVSSILSALRDQREELIRLRDEALERSESVEATAGDTGRSSGAESASSDADTRVVRLRMQGIVDRMQAGVARLVELSVTLRDIETGLIDFPALVNGRPIWLCWRLGEGDIEWWHELSTGFSGRERLRDLT
ncbi:MAG TPA: DUF2203 domain-containing protein [Candidatus Limnocylindrales bacterium]